MYGTLLFTQSTYSRPTVLLPLVFTLSYFSFSFFFQSYVDHRALHSFPTRRSSDLRFARYPFATASAIPAPGCTSVVKDRKSTRLNSSHVAISYAVFCLKKKKHNETTLKQVEHTYQADARK